MFGLLYTLSTWLQPAVSSGSGTAAPGPGSAGGGGPAGCQGGLSQLGLMAVMMVVFYLVLLRPQQKRQKETDALLKSLKKGQKVRTTSGVRGEIIDFKQDSGDEVVLLVSDRVKINILRSHIAGLVEAREEAQKS